MFFLLSTRCAKVLKAIDPEMTAHSVKRGALTALLRAGAPLSVIQVIAKHKDLETLLVYLYLEPSCRWPSEPRKRRDFSENSNDRRPS